MVIDAEVKQLLQRSHERATVLLEAHRAQLDTLAQGLIEYESLSGAEIVDILNGKEVRLSTEKENAACLQMCCSCNSDIVSFRTELVGREAVVVVVL